MSLVTYGTEVISKKSYIRLFGNKKYELPEPVNYPPLNGLASV